MALKSLRSYTGLPHLMYFEFLSIFLYNSWVVLPQRKRPEALPDRRPLFSFVQVSYLLNGLHLGADQLIFHHSRTMSIKCVRIIGFEILGYDKKQDGCFRSPHDFLCHEPQTELS